MNYTELQQLAEKDLRTTATILTRWLQQKQTERFAFLTTLYLTPQQMEELTYFYLDTKDNTKLWQGIAVVTRTLPEKEIQQEYPTVLQKYQEEYPSANKIANFLSLFSTSGKRSSKKEY